MIDVVGGEEILREFEQPTPRFRVYFDVGYKVFIGMVGLERGDDHVDRACLRLNLLLLFGCGVHMGDWRPLRQHDGGHYKREDSKALHSMALLTDFNREGYQMK